MEETTRKRGRYANRTISRPKRPSSASDDGASLSTEDRLSLLRRNAAILYDTFLNHHLDWASLSVAWGGIPDPKDRVLGDIYSDEFNTEQNIYFAGRTNGTLDVAARVWTGTPGELFVGRVAIPNPRTVNRGSIAKFKEGNRSSRVGVYKRIIHPGEVNRIRSLPQAPHIIATHTDSSTVFVWNTDTQPNRTENMSEDGKAPTLLGPTGPQKKKNTWSETCACSVPDAELIGHTSAAEYGLDTKASSKVLSAGSDKLVILWSLEDSTNENNQIKPRVTFRGHNAAVEDCSFRPMDDGNGDRCCSVGQDRSLYLWDARTGTYTDHIEDIHADDANCCCWGSNDYILTGGSDSVVNVFDVRKLDRPVSSVMRKASVIHVRWSPHDSEVFVTSDESADLTLYRFNDGDCNVMFQHYGHRTTATDAQFNPLNPWVLASVSDESADASRGGGGTLQLWRINEFVYKTTDDVEWATEVTEKLGGAAPKTSNSSEEEGSGGDE